MREKLFKYYASCIPTLAEFNELMDALTEDYSCMFINYKSKTNNLEDCIFYIRPDINAVPDNWKMGCKEFWDFAKERYNIQSKNEF